MKATGTIYDIQSFSVQDGPGIRLTIFLKGCPLRCPWCHSPESQGFGPELNWMRVKCMGTEACGSCVAACPKGAASLGEETDETGREKRYPWIDGDRCVGCFQCVEACPPKALYICGREYSVEELMTRIRREKPFLDRSGGGVTISGGECLCQPEFVRHLLRACKAEGIHTAVDTSGYTAWEHVWAVLPDTDLFLYDIKHMDSIRHKEVIRVPNEPILDNARKIAERGGQMQVRIPLIPGFNDDEENIRKTGAFLRELGSAVTCVQLLPYHNLGVVKWDRLGRRPPEFETAVPSDELVEQCRMLLEQFGLTVTIH